MEKIDEILQRHVVSGDVTKDKLLGAAFVAVNRDGTIYSSAAGRLNLDPTSQPVAPDSFTWVASLTKLITTTCVMQLVEQGLVQLDDDMRALVPELGDLNVLCGFDNDGQPILEETNNPITLRMLLTHTVGIAYDNMDPKLEKWSKATNRKVTNLSFTKEGYTTPLHFHPGEGWMYGTSLDWAGLCLEKITGSTLGAYMQEHVFDPVSMKDTGFRPDRIEGADSRTLQLTLRLPDETLAPFALSLPKEPTIEGGGAGLYTTAGDYAKFLRAFLRGEFLKAETATQMFTPQLNDQQRTMLQETADMPENHIKYVPELPVGAKISAGIGGLINLADVPGKRVAGSLGWSGACNSRWWLDPATGVAGVLVVNCLMWGDAVSTRLFNELERAVYEDLASRAA